MLIVFHAPNHTLTSGALQIRTWARLKSVLGILIFYLPFFVFIISTNIRKIKYIILFFVPLLLFMGLEFYQSYYGVSQLQTNFIKFNQLRGKIHGYPKYSSSDNSAMLNDNNWTENDYNMFKSWIFFDENIYNPQTLQYVINLTPNQKIGFSELQYYIVDFARKFGKHFLLLILISMWISCSKLRSYRNGFLFLYFIYSFLIMFYMETVR